MMPLFRLQWTIVSREVGLGWLAVGAAVSGSLGLIHSEMGAPVVALAMAATSYFGCDIVRRAEAMVWPTPLSLRSRAQSEGAFLACLMLMVTLLAGGLNLRHAKVPLLDSALTLLALWLGGTSLALVCQLAQISAERFTGGKVASSVLVLGVQATVVYNLVKWAPPGIGTSVAFILGALLVVLFHRRMRLGAETLPKNPGVQGLRDESIETLRRLRDAEDRAGAGAPGAPVPAAKGEGRADLAQSPQGTVSRKVGPDSSPSPSSILVRLAMGRSGFWAMLVLSAWMTTMSSHIWVLLFSFCLLGVLYSGLKGWMPFVHSPFSRRRAFLSLILPPLLAAVLLGGLRVGLVSVWGEDRFVGPNGRPYPELPRGWTYERELLEDRIGPAVWYSADRRAKAEGLSELFRVGYDLHVDTATLLALDPAAGDPQAAPSRYDRTWLVRIQDRYGSEIRSIMRKRHALEALTALLGFMLFAFFALPGRFLLRLGLLRILGPQILLILLLMLPSGFWTQRAPEESRKAYRQLLSQGEARPGAALALGGVLFTLLAWRHYQAFRNRIGEI